MNSFSMRAMVQLVAIASVLAVSNAAAASGAEVDRSVVTCVKDALGSAAAPILAGDESAMSRLDPRERGLVEGCVLTNGRVGGRVSKRPPVLKVSPMDPAVVTAMSRFRSCAGHDYSGLNVQGQPERNRSMKHYLYVNRPWTATGTVPVQAPFSGRAIVSVEVEYPLGSWVRVLHPSGWVFTAFHIDPAVRDGQKITAGQRIGTFPPANAPDFMPERMGEPEANFDFTLQSTDGRIASFVDWMSPAAVKPWQERGFSSDALTIAKGQRDASPCPANFPDGPGTTGFVQAAASG